jgi:hypothetical protein
VQEHEVPELLQDHQRTLRIIKELIDEIDEQDGTVAAKQKRTDHAAIAPEAYRLLAKEI